LESVETFLIKPTTLESLVSKQKTTHQYNYDYLEDVKRVLVDYSEPILLFEEEEQDPIEPVLNLSAETIVTASTPIVLLDKEKVVASIPLSHPKCRDCDIHLLAETIIHRVNIS
jgi:hypothetical protein